MTRALRGLTHLAALVALGAAALALGRWLRDPTISGGVGLVLVFVLVAVALRWLYRPGGMANPAPAPPAANVEGVTPNVEGVAPPPLFDDRLDLNAAGLDELVTLPGVGPVAAMRIMEERRANGRFATVEELVRVPGFGAAKVRALADRVRV